MDVVRFAISFNRDCPGVRIKAGREHLEVLLLHTYIYFITDEHIFLGTELTLLFDPHGCSGAQHGGRAPSACCS